MKVIVGVCALIFLGSLVSVWREALSQMATETVYLFLKLRRSLIEGLSS